MSSENWVDISDFLGLKKGEMTDYDYGDKKLMIANIGGTFYASDRVCTHAYVDLTGGILNESKKTVTCPLHLSSFDMNNGNALNLPAEDPLKIYKIKKEKKSCLFSCRLFGYGFGQTRNNYSDKKMKESKIKDGKLFR